MKTLQSLFTLPIHSIYSHSPILNQLLDGEEEELEEQAEEENTAPEEGSNPEYQEGETDELEEKEDTPAGKKFAAMRTARVVAEAKAQQEREARLIAEAKVEAYAQALAIKGSTTQEKQEEEIEVNPQDEEVVLKVLRKQGIDISSLKELKKLPQQTQQMVFEQNMERAIGNLTAKYKDSVPFNRDKVIEYVKENKLLASYNAPLERVFEIAHKEMNEDAIAEFKYQQRVKTKKIVPKISNTGTGEKKVVETKPGSNSDYRKLAMELAGANDE